MMASLLEKKQLLTELFFSNEKENRFLFIAKTFHAFFELIPEAATGSIFELKNGYYLPVAYHGHDPTVIKALKFKSSEAFFLHDSMLKSSSKVYSTKIPSRVNDPELSGSAKEILKELGMLGEFYCIYAPIRRQGDIIGMVSVEKIDSHFSEKDAGLILRYYAHLLSEYYEQIIF